MTVAPLSLTVQDVRAQTPGIQTSGIQTSGIQTGGRHASASATATDQGATFAALLSASANGTTSVADDKAAAAPTRDGRSPPSDADAAASDLTAPEQNAPISPQFGGALFISLVPAQPEPSQTAELQTGQLQTGGQTVAAQAFAQPVTAAPNPSGLAPRAAPSSPSAFAIPDPASAPTLAPTLAPAQGASLRQSASTPTGGSAQTVQDAATSNAANARTDAPNVVPSARPTAAAQAKSSSQSQQQAQLQPDAPGAASPAVTALLTPVANPESGPEPKSEPRPAIKSAPAAASRPVSVPVSTPGSVPGTDALGANDILVAKQAEPTPGNAPTTPSVAVSLTAPSQAKPDDSDPVPVKRDDPASPPLARAGIGNGDGVSTPIAAGRSVASAAPLNSTPTNASAQSQLTTQAVFQTPSPSQTQVPADSAATSPGAISQTAAQTVAASDPAVGPVLAGVADAKPAAAAPLDLAPIGIDPETRNDALPTATSGPQSADAGALSIPSSPTAGPTTSLSSLSLATIETTARLAAQITRQLNGRSTRFEMGLTPEGLGRVDVRMEIDADGQLTARLSFDNPLAATDLRGRADELRSQLQDAGFKLAHDALNFSQRDTSGGGADPRQSRAFAAASRVNADADTDALPTASPWISRSQTPRGVDMKV